MSKWSEYLGDGYLASRGRFVPIRLWKAGFDAMQQEVVNVSGYGNLRGFTARNRVWVPDYRYCGRSDRGYIASGCVDAEDPINDHGVIQYLDRSAWLAKAGYETALAVPQTWEPLRSEYLWMCKRLTDVQTSFVHDYLRGDLDSEDVSVVYDGSGTWNFNVTDAGWVCTARFSQQENVSNPTFRRSCALRVSGVLPYYRLRRDVSTVHARWGYRASGISVHNTSWENTTFLHPERTTPGWVWCNTPVSLRQIDEGLYFEAQTRFMQLPFLSSNGRAGFCFESPRLVLDLKDALEFYDPI